MLFCRKLIISDEIFALCPYDQTRTSAVFSWHDFSLFVALSLLPYVLRISSTWFSIYLSRCCFCPMFDAFLNKILRIVE